MATSSSQTVAELRQAARVEPAPYPLKAWYNACLETVKAAEHAESAGHDREAFVLWLRAAHVADLMKNHEQLPQLKAKGDGALYATIKGFLTAKVGLIVRRAQALEDVLKAEEEAEAAAAAEAEPAPEPPTNGHSHAVVSPPPPPPRPLQPERVDSGGRSSAGSLAERMARLRTSGLSDPSTAAAATSSSTPSPPHRPPPLPPQQPINPTSPSSRPRSPIRPSHRPNPSLPTVLPSALPTEDADAFAKTFPEIGDIPFPSPEKHASPIASQAGSGGSGDWEHIPPARQSPRPPTVGNGDWEHVASARQSPQPGSGAAVRDVIYPHTLYTYLSSTSAGDLSVLLLDVRPLESYQRRRIRAAPPGGKGRANIIWVNPKLLREGVQPREVDSCISQSSRRGYEVYAQRGAYDLIVLYDESSVTPPPHLSCLASLLGPLRRPALVLVGGFEAYERELGPDAVEHPHAPPANGKPAPSPPPLRDPPRAEVNGVARPASAAAEPHSDSAIKRAHRMAAMTPDGYRPASPEAYGMPIPQASIHSRLDGHNPYFPPQPPYPYSAHSAPSFPPSTSSSSSFSFSPKTQHPALPTPPTASRPPAQLARRRSDYVDQQQPLYSGYGHQPRLSVDYPSLAPRLPPPAASPLSAPARAYQPPPPPPAPEGDGRALWTVQYWGDDPLGLTGLKNLGNTCYMNSTLQCLSATVPFARFFSAGVWRKAVNPINPLGTKGALADSFAQIIIAMWREQFNFISPLTFRKAICSFAPQFQGTDQHDAQEFLSFLLDGLHEDLNAVVHKPPAVEMTPEREEALERLPTAVAGQKEWAIYKMQNDSIVVDWFQGQFRNRMECLTCHKTSTTYNSFMYLSLPVPSGRSFKSTTLTQCVDAFLKDEIMDKDDAWYCPRCKARRKSLKRLTISRLPPVLLIQLKRFSFHGPFSDKIETLVQYPIRGLDLTGYMAGASSGGGASPYSDPRAQTGSFRYDLYGVTNHYGSLGSGHYTAFVSSGREWHNAADSKISRCDERDVVSRSGYLLYYKRVPR